MFNSDTCRCGWKEGEDHLCHGCHERVATARSLTHPVGLAGFHFKLGVYTTWACDECWTAHKAQLRLHASVLQIVKDEEIRDLSGHCGFAYDDDIDSWVLDINGEIRATFPIADIPALDGNTSETKQAIEAIYEHKFGDEDPLGARLIGEIKGLGA